MKIIPIALAGVLMLEPATTIEPKPRTSADLYMRSYAEQMRGGVLTPAEVRAAEYRRHYEACDEDHVCRDPSGGEFVVLPQGTDAIIAVRSALA